MLSYIRLVIATKTRDGERGASAVEYGLLVAAIAALVVGVVFGLGSTIKGKFTQTQSCISTSGAASGC
ncbi:MAG: Flp family type IVb pilin [Mycobacterium sp.]|jgi:pilus assembly protein Flp/PilA|nr:Flp family type IVb pilin [Mycobacterium sp.]